jgi:hypothetical protein
MVGGEEEKPQVPVRLRSGQALHYATPDFLLSLVASASFMRLSLLKAAHVAVGEIHVQEIRVRSGPTARRGRRDDNSVAEWWELVDPTKLRSERCGIPHLAKNERDVGHPSLAAGTVSQFLFALAEEQANGQETAGEKGSKASLQTVVMEEGEQAVDPPGGSQRKPDQRATHGPEIISRHCFNPADTLPEWRPRLPRVRLLRPRLRRAWRIPCAGWSRSTWRAGSPLRS